MRWYANVLLAAKGPCVCSALQALQIATSSVARGCLVRLRGDCGWQDRMERCRGRGWPRLLRGIWLLKKGCHRGDYANVLLAVKGPCASSAVQAL